MASERDTVITECIAAVLSLRHGEREPWERELVETFTNAACWRLHQLRAPSVPADARSAPARSHGEGADGE